jgi:hypothetical protein
MLGDGLYTTFVYAKSEKKAGDCFFPELLVSLFNTDSIILTYKMSCDSFVQ